ncbi:hypothetical protein [Azospirillum thermophilum]|uniref:Uncharacterized protein n=1 Tax=Azospirillum thermophilum TaxID=2202148 RepID=A0A2S2CKI5_9PROT|nr:hypothetical protein [Azospirillum thermophilum]AWK85013.1 hypothetical protein DEW08_01400 [Azospirillum thermophilum]
MPDLQGYRIVELFEYSHEEGEWVPTGLYAIVHPDGTLLDGTYPSPEAAAAAIEAILQLDAAPVPGKK